ncbi:MAG TPA: cyclic nucleotide-binding domain-containing protein, partial [Acidimicrobiales bacterium]|nr:cyclic nucleotide-binding domain-containing protein [Acidimicrobiales bacterium]
MAIDVLQLSDGLPERRLAAGEVLYDQGDLPTDVVILVEGTLRITAGDLVIDTLSSPGTFVGEIGALLGQPRDATVSAVEETLVRVVGDPAGFVADRPELGLEIARQLAGRLHRLTAYIGDVQRQFADRDDHLGMFAEVLGRL